MLAADLLSSAHLISQGAEAKVYKANLYDSGPPVLLKYRFPKTYRHPRLDASLTKSRLGSEARALVRCQKYGVSVPAVRYVESTLGILALEWINGISVRQLLGGGSDTIPQHSEKAPALEEGGAARSLQDMLEKRGISLDKLMQIIGQEIARMHRADVVHGDLTTSNMMLEDCLNGEIPPRLVLIDFGLSFNSAMVEDKAVDLYVLERAFSSTHPASEPMFVAVLDGYAAELGRDWGPIHKRLEEGPSAAACDPCPNSFAGFQCDCGDESEVWWDN